MKDMAQPLVAIVILNWNNPSDTVACLDSVARLDFPNFTVLVVDNGSTDDSVACIRAAHPEVEIIETGENLGYAGGNNAGIRRAFDEGADYALLLNNDTLVAPSMLRELLKVTEFQPGIGMIGPTVYSSESAEEVLATGSFVRWAKGEIWHRDSLPPANEPGPVDSVIGCGILVSRTLVDASGGLDPRYYLNYEDIEWGVRAWRHGFEVWYAPQAVMWHKVSSTLGLASPASTYYMTRNGLLFFSTHAPGIWRAVAPARIVLRTIRTVAAWTLRPCYRKNPIFRRRRDANLLALRDFFLGRFHRMGPDVAAICYGER